MSETSPLDDLMRGIEETIKNTRVQGEIEFPIEVSGIKMAARRSSRRQDQVGAWCSVRPCAGDKTYLGVYLGDLNLDALHSYNVEDKALTIMPHTNPAVFVPDLKRVVWGCESWWGIITNPEGLRKITDADIENVWYVRALKELSIRDE